MYLLLLLLAALPFASPSPLETTLHTQNNLNRTLQFGIFRFKMPPWATWPPRWVRCLMKGGPDSTGLTAATGAANTPAEPVVCQECDCTEAVATAAAEAAFNTYAQYGCPGATDVPCVLEGAFVCRTRNPTNDFMNICSSAAPLVVVPPGSVCRNLENGIFWVGGVNDGVNCPTVEVVNGLVSPAADGDCITDEYPGICV